MSVWKIINRLFHYKHRCWIQTKLKYEVGNTSVPVHIFKSVNQFCVFTIHVTNRSFHWFSAFNTIVLKLHAVLNTVAPQDASCLHSSWLCWLCRSVLTSCILFSFGYVRWVDSCTIPFSRLSSSPVWEEEGPLRTIMSVCGCSFDLRGRWHFSWVSNTLLCMQAFTWLHFYVHTVLSSLNSLLIYMRYLHPVLSIPSNAFHSWMQTMEKK